MGISPEEVIPNDLDSVDGEELPMLLLGFAASVLAWVVCSAFCHGAF